MDVGLNLYPLEIIDHIMKVTFPLVCKGTNWICLLKLCNPVHTYFVAVAILIENFQTGYNSSEH